MTKPCIIFDFDGTLADTLTVNFEIINQLAQWFRFRAINKHELQHLKTLPAREVLKFLEIANYKYPFVLAAGKHLLSKRIEQLPVPDELIALLSQFADTHTVGVLSTNSKKNIKKYFAGSFPDKLPFHFIYANARLLGKQYLIKKALKQHDLQPQQVLYVGDEIRDITAARALGLSVCAVTWGYNTKAVLQAQAPDYLVDDLTQLSDVVSAFSQAD